MNRIKSQYWCFVPFSQVADAINVQLYNVVTLSHSFQTLTRFYSLYFELQLDFKALVFGLKSSLWFYLVHDLIVTQKDFSCIGLNDILHNNCVGLLAASKCYLPTRSRRISRLNQNFKWSNKIFKFVFKLKVQSTQHLIDINPRSCKNW